MHIVFAYFIYADICMNVSVRVYVCVHVRVYQCVYEYISVYMFKCEYVYPAFVKIGCLKSTGLIITFPPIHMIHGDSTCSDSPIWTKKALQPS